MEVYFIVTWVNDMEHTKIIHINSDTSKQKNSRQFMSQYQTMSMTLRYPRNNSNCLAPNNGPFERMVSSDLRKVLVVMGYSLKQPNIGSN